MLDELRIQEGKLYIRVDSNGCTEAQSFRVDVKTEEGISVSTPHYRLTIDMIRIDECRAMRLDGVDIVFDFEKDLGLTGTFTISVDDRVLVRPKARS